MRPILPAILAAALALPAVAADFSDPDWPCVQRKVVNLSWGMMWTGLPIDESLGDWRDDPEIRALAETIAVRRTPIEEAEARIAAFADGLGEDRERRLALLFKAAFELIDRERAQIVNGIGRYARKQAGLAERIDEARIEFAALTEAERAAEGEDLDRLDRIEELEDQIAWDTRIFDERQRSLTYVCESPVLLEQRAFALARAIMAHLP